MHLILHLMEQIMKQQIPIILQIIYRLEFGGLFLLHLEVGNNTH